MKEIEGYDVKIFTDNVEESAIEQIRRLLSVDVFSNCKIRIMPDVHAGAGCVIGFTGNLGDRVIPNIVGVDIGCGIAVQPFVCKKEIDFHSFNEYIVKNIPSGRDYRTIDYNPLPGAYTEKYVEAKQLVTELRCYRELKEIGRLYKAIASLGGGNHFIEIDKDSNGLYYLVVHTGSRNLGKQVAMIYQQLAVKCQSGWDELVREKNRLIEEYKSAGRRSELKDVVRNLHNSFKMRRPSIPEDLCYLEKEFRDDYLHDMHICQKWAQINNDIRNTNSLIASRQNSGSSSSSSTSSSSGNKQSISKSFANNILLNEGYFDYIDDSPSGYGTLTNSQYAIATRVYEMFEQGLSNENAKEILAENGFTLEQISGLFKGEDE